VAGKWEISTSEVPKRLTLGCPLMKSSTGAMGKSTAGVLKCMGMTSLGLSTFSTSCASRLSIV